LTYHYACSNIPPDSRGSAVADLASIIVFMGTYKSASEADFKYSTMVKNRMGTRF
jgi:hypothetical protein